MSERFPWILLQSWLFAPELPWQSTGKWRILQGCARETLGVGEYALENYTTVKCVMVPIGS